jgi:restriction modification system DNA specificity domain protein
MDSITMTTEQQLPEGWKIERLGDVCSPPQYGFTTKAVENGTIRLLRTTDITNGKINWTDVPFCYENPDNIEKYLLQDGDIVISRAGSVGVSYLINNPPHSVFASYLIRFQPFINKKYFYFFLKSLAYWKQISESSVGIAVPNVNASKLKNILIPVAPQETQQAIVNKIESLFDEIDEGIGRLKTAAQQIQQYRQSLLKNAFNGELTKEWRSKHADTLPSENELLAQIQTTREQHHAQQLADWQTAVSQWEQNGKEGKKPSKPKAPTQAVKFEDNFADLPNGWGMVKLENLASEYVLGKMLDKNKNKGKERLYLGNINVRWGYFEFSNAKTMKIEDDEIERYSVKYGDLIICEGGEPGRCAVWKHEAEMFIQKALHRVRFPSYYSADFAFYYLSYAVKLPLVTDLLTGTTIKHLTGTALKNIPFPVCSISEQTQIVAILETKLTACDQLAAELAKQLKQAELLKQAVLKAAFSGSLLDK